MKKVLNVEPRRVLLQAVNPKGGIVVAYTAKKADQAMA